MESISIFKSVSSKNFSNASIKIIKPGGIEIPACVISPSEAPLPPARDTSFLLIFLKSRSNSISKFILSVFFSFLKSLKTKSETLTRTPPPPPPRPRPGRLPAPAAPTRPPPRRTHPPGALRFPQQRRHWRGFLRGGGG